MATRAATFLVYVDLSRGHAARQDEEHAHAKDRYGMNAFWVRGHGTRHATSNTRALIQPSSAVPAPYSTLRSASRLPRGGHETRQGCSGIARSPTCLPV